MLTRALCRTDSEHHELGLVVERVLLRPEAARNSLPTEGTRTRRVRISSDPADDYETLYTWDHRKLDKEF